MAQTNEFSKRECEVIELLLQGKSNKQIALVLGITEHTVEFHLKNIYKKLNVGSRVEAIIKLRDSLGGDIAVIGETAVDIVDENTHNKNRSISQRQAASFMTLKLSLQEISSFLVTYKIPIIIWLLILCIICIVLALMSQSKTAWKYEREGEYPDKSTVGMVLQRPDASDQMVHGQFGTVPAWPAQPGYVKYEKINIPRTDHLFLKLRYSKYSSSDVLIFIYLDDELVPRAKILPVNQGSWDKFVWTDAIDLGSVTRGKHSIKFYTDGQVYGVADLDKFNLTIEPP